MNHKISGIDINSFDLVIVGAGFFGLTVAERTARLLNKKVLVIEKREHVGGNAYSYFDSNSGIEIHKYGSHIFHTSNKIVWDYVNEFTTFNNYKHKVYAFLNNKYYPIPINLSTISQFLNQPMNPAQAERYFNEVRRLDNDKDNLESRAISLVGKDLYEAFYKGYTIKQWRKDPVDLPADIIQRIPVRSNFNNNYFDDDFEGIPTGGYSQLFQNMLNHKNICTILETDFFNLRKEFKYETPMVYTGPVDRYFDYIHGQLGWRSVDFEIEHFEIKDFQGTSVVNYPELKYPFTRIHEFKHFHPENREQMSLNSTVIMKEYSIDTVNGVDPYYPVNSRDDKVKIEKYRKLVELEKEKNIYFGGRLGTYKYLDMHMAIASALGLFNNQISKLWR